MRTGDVFLYHTRNSPVSAVLRFGSHSRWTHIVKLIVWRLIIIPEALQKKYGLPPEVWVYWDTPYILEHAKEVWVEVAHASKHGKGVGTELASRNIQNHDGAVAWIPLRHDEAKKICPQYQSKIWAETIWNRGLPFSMGNIYRFWKLLRVFFPRDTAKWYCSHYAAMVDMVCGFAPEKKHCTPPEVVWFGLYLKENGVVLVSDPSVRLKLFNDGYVPSA